jgi:hypothetical protein
MRDRLKRLRANLKALEEDNATFALVREAGL